MSSATSHPKAADLIKVLNNPIRRSILRFLLNSDQGSANPAEIRSAVTRYMAPNLVNFHLDILLTAGAVVREKQPGSRENTYTYTPAIQADWFLTALCLTAAED